jgi:hypothetical protein
MHAYICSRCHQAQSTNFFSVKEARRRLTSKLGLAIPVIAGKTAAREAALLQSELFLINDVLVMIVIANHRYVLC